MRSHSHLYAVDASELAAIKSPCRDPNDNKFLALAQVAEAATLVTSDEDMLVLHPWNGIAILTASDFLSYAVA